MHYAYDLAHYTVLLTCWIMHYVDELHYVLADYIMLYTDVLLHVHYSCILSEGQFGKFDYKMLRLFLFLFWVVYYIFIQVDLDYVYNCFD